MSAIFYRPKFSNPMFSIVFGESLKFLPVFITKAVLSEVGLLCPKFSTRYLPGGAIGVSNIGITE